jgi:OmcA/MtrC family decaheme c-type cytochrome
VDDVNVLVAALTEMQVNFKNHPTDGFSQDDNSNCAGCHANDNLLVSGITVENVHAQTAQLLAQQFQFNILDITYESTSRDVTVTFSVTDPADNSNYDLATNPAFTAGFGGSRMAILIGWNTVDYHNTSSNSVPAQPISLDPLFGGAVNNGDNTFRMTATLPAEASGTGVVGIEGHPLLNGVRIPVDNVVDYFPITDAAAVPRRQVVSIDKCNDCHDNLSLHGNNRQGTVDICLICHNANATDIDVRPATLDSEPDGVFDDFSVTGVDGKREESIHFKTMIHAIHAGEAAEHGSRENGIVVYGFGRSVHDYSDVRYPGTLSNCNACHVDGSYNLPTPTGSLPTTVQTADGSLTGVDADNALASRADDLNISADAATCYSCHDTAIAQEHMEIVGNASFDLTESAIAGASGEICQACHGPGEFLAVDEVHSLSSSE